MDIHYYTLILFPIRKYVESSFLDKYEEIQ